MAQAAADISPELKQEFEAIAEAGWKLYMDNCTEEQKQRGLEEAKLWANEEYKAQ